MENKTHNFCFKRYELWMMEARLWFTRTTDSFNICLVGFKKFFFFVYCYNAFNCSDGQYNILKQILNKHLTKQKITNQTLKDNI